MLAEGLGFKVQLNCIHFQLWAYPSYSAWLLLIVASSWWGYGYGFLSYRDLRKMAVYGKSSE